MCLHQLMWILKRAFRCNTSMSRRETNLISEGKISTICDHKFTKNLHDVTCRRQEPDLVGRNPHTKTSMNRRQQCTKWRYSIAHLQRLCSCTTLFYQYKYLDFKNIQAHLKALYSADQIKDSVWFWSFLKFSIYNFPVAAVQPNWKLQKNEKFLALATSRDSVFKIFRTEPSKGSEASYSILL